MALIEIKAEPGLLRELVTVLNRIAEVLERAYPPRPNRKEGAIGREALTHISDEELWERQKREEAARLPRR